MSYQSEASLFYGVVFDDTEELLNIFQVMPKDFYKIEEILMEEEFKLVFMGNTVLGDLSFGISTDRFVCDEGSKYVSFGESIFIEKDRIEELDKFLKKYNIDKTPGWYLASCYG